MINFQHRCVTGSREISIGYENVAESELQGQNMMGMQYSPNCSDR